MVEVVEVAIDSFHSVQRSIEQFNEKTACTNCMESETLQLETYSAELAWLGHWLMHAVLLKLSNAPRLVKEPPGDHL